MSKETKHTALPWVFEKLLGDESYILMQGKIAVGHIFTVEDAKHIVNCVNAYDELKTFYDLCKLQMGDMNFKKYHYSQHFLEGKLSAILSKLQAKELTGNDE